MEGGVGGEVSAIEDEGAEDSPVGCGSGGGAASACSENVKAGELIEVGEVEIHICRGAGKGRVDEGEGCGEVASAMVGDDIAADDCARLQGDELACAAGHADGIAIAAIGGGDFCLVVEEEMKSAAGVAGLMFHHDSGRALDAVCEGAADGDGDGGGGIMCHGVDGFSGGFDISGRDAQVAGALMIGIDTIHPGTASDIPRDRSGIGVDDHLGGAGGGFGEDAMSIVGGNTAAAARYLDCQRAVALMVGIDSGSLDTGGCIGGALLRSGVDCIDLDGHVAACAG